MADISHDISQDISQDIVKDIMDTPFLPSDVPGLEIWYDAADSSTITKDMANLVSQWDDKSGNGRDLSQLTASQQPAFIQSAINAQPALRFDGIDDTIATAVINNIFTNELNIFIVCLVRGGTLILIQQNASTNRIAMRNSSGVVRYEFKNITTGVLLGNTVFTNAPHLVTLRTEASVQEIFIDGVSDASQANAFSIAAFSRPFRLGAGNSAGSIAADVDISEVIAFARTLTTTESNNLTNYALSKYNL